MVLHEKVPIDGSLCLIRLVQEVSIASEVNSNLVLEIKKFIEQFVFIGLGAVPPKFFPCAFTIKPRLEAMLGISLAAKPHLSDNTGVVKRIVFVAVQICPVRLLPFFRDLSDKSDIIRYISQGIANSATTLQQLRQFLRSDRDAARTAVVSLHGSPQVDRTEYHHSVARQRSL